nr:DUF305 domain-containing protein [Rhizobium freirei]
MATALAAAISCGYSAVAQDAASNKNDPAAAKIAAEQPYLAENDAAMTKMMDDMEAKPTGDIDRDFVVMMTPHHQGAIDMAQAYLRYGTNEQLKRIAQEIIVDQQQEIAAMKIPVGDPLPPSDAAPTQVTPQTAPAGAMKAMSPDMKM